MASDMPRADKLARIIFYATLLLWIVCIAVAFFWVILS
jgi:hypothetical protein